MGYGTLGPVNILSSREKSLLTLIWDAKNRKKYWRFFEVFHCNPHLQIAEMIRHLLDHYNKPIPAVLEIPSKDHPYDPSKDSILRRAKVCMTCEVTL